jgi:hypothetical protein
MKIFNIQDYLNIIHIIVKQNIINIAVSIIKIIIYQ